MNYLVEQLKIDTMRRIYAIHAFRAATPLVFEAVVFGVVVWGLTVFVSFSHVLSNIPATLNVGKQFSFAMNAFGNTELPVYILFTLALGLLGMVIRSVWKLIAPAWNTQTFATDQFEQLRVRS